MNMVTELLSSRHRKKEFSCGKGMLDNYLHRQANQDVKRKLSACFVMADPENQLIKGYYTLSNNSLPQETVPPDFRKKLPDPYTSIPTTLLGRLAVDERFKGQGLGRILLVEALKRSCELSKSIGSFAVIADPLDNEAVQFYRKYGFYELPDSGKMFLPMKIVHELFR